jgi:exodeoxyribonuclease-1
MSKTFYWYDFEATGIDPRRDRPLQVAGVRTDEDLNEIGEPLCIDCRLPDDVLPHPMACLITGIGPQRAMAGLPEAQFIDLLHEQMAVPGTCSVGYNNLRYDDEMARFTLYRNFHDPYAREWQGGNSRWDLLDALRATHALRPDGIVWPQQDGHTSLRLELMTAANGIDHGQAHDALADVRATIAMARLLRAAQPRLFDYLLDMRSKQRVSALVDFQQMRPLVHVSGKFGRERQGLALVLPLAWHPQNRNALIVYDLASDPDLLVNLSAEDLRQRLYQRREDMAAGQVRPGLKLVHINKCPFLADVKVLRGQDIDRLGLNMPELIRNGERLARWRAEGQQKLQTIYQPEDTGAAASDDAESQLYAGFISDADRKLLGMIREADGGMLAAMQWPLRDQRLVDMLPRYRARNFPESLTSVEAEQWQDYCRKRLGGEVPGASLTLDTFMQAVDQAQVGQQGTPAELLQSWRVFALERAVKLGIALV